MLALIGTLLLVAPPSRDTSDAELAITAAIHAVLPRAVADIHRPEAFRRIVLDSETVSSRLPALHKEGALDRISRTVASNAGVRRLDPPEECATKCLLSEDELGVLVDKIVPSDDGFEIRITVRWIRPATNKEPLQRGFSEYLVTLKRVGDEFQVMKLDHLLIT